MKLLKVYAITTQDFALYAYITTTKKNYNLKLECYFYYKVFIIYFHKIQTGPSVLMKVLINLKYMESLEKTVEPSSS